MYKCKVRYGVTKDMYGNLYEYGSYEFIKDSEKLDSINFKVNYGKAKYRYNDSKASIYAVEKAKKILENIGKKRGELIIKNKKQVFDLAYELYNNMKILTNRKMRLRKILKILEGKN